MSASKLLIEDLHDRREVSAPPSRSVFRKPEHYIVSKELDRAAYVALLLGQPLLLTGEPGAGKSDFARKLTQVFDLGEVEEAHVKTTTVGRDLLYSFDDVGRFRDATGNSEDAGTHPLSRYVRFNGLGRAILRSAGPDTPVMPIGVSVKEILGRQPEPGEALTLRSLFPWEFERRTSPDAPSLQITEKLRTVVLIDEIDKAQRDTPNDLLDEIERMQFEIAELGIVVKASPAHWPIVVITSNAERALPSPFLRRCVFHRLVTPEDPETLRSILESRLAESFSPGPAIDDALLIFRGIRKSQGPRPPGLSELLAWCLLLKRMKLLDGPTLPKGDDEAAKLLEASLAALSKSDPDFDVARRVLLQWKGGNLELPDGPNP